MAITCIIHKPYLLLDVLSLTMDGSQQTEKERIFIFFNQFSMKVSAQNHPNQTLTFDFWAEGAVKAAAEPRRRDATATSFISLRCSFFLSKKNGHGCCRTFGSTYVGVGICFRHVTHT